MFYSFCPLNNHTMCTDATSMIFEASQTPQKFKFDKLRRKRDDEGNPLQMDACTYQVTIPSFTFKSGKVIIRFNKISDNKIYINAGSGVNNASQVVVPDNGTVTLNTEYEVDVNSGSYIIIVLPDEDSENTEFEFQYWIDGEQLSTFRQWWSKSFKTPQGQGMLVVIIIGLVCCVGICFFGVSFFIKQGDDAILKHKAQIEQENEKQA